MTDQNNPPAITPEKVRRMLLDIQHFGMVPKAVHNFTSKSQDIAREYLKLHEENMHLKQKLLDERGCDVDGCSAHFKAFSKENHSLKIEIDVLEGIIEKQRDILLDHHNRMNANPFYEKSEFWLRTEEALALTATEEQPK